MSTRKRRGRTEGSIFQRESDGLWVGTISLGYDGKGKRKRRVVYAATKKEVLDKIDQLKQDERSGIKVEPTKITLKDLIDRWLELEVKPNRTTNTYKCYSGTANLHILPRIGRIRLRDLDAIRVAELYAELERDGVPARTRELVHTVLRRVLKRAVAWKLKGFNPAADAEKPRVTRRDIPTVSADQANELLEAAAGHRLSALFVLTVATGMRQGELFALRWQDIDLIGGEVHVRHSLEEVDGKLRLKEPKTKNGKRTVSLPQLARESLARHRERMVVEKHHGPDFPVFCNSDGGFLRKSNFLRKVYAPIVSKAGLTGIRFHDWRHFHASQLVELGTNTKVVQERLGHADVSTTLRFYVHPRHEEHQAAADRFDEAFRESKARSQKKTGTE